MGGTQQICPPGNNDVTDPLQAGPCPDPPRANLLGTHSSSARPWARE